MGTSNHLSGPAFRRLAISLAIGSLAINSHTAFANVYGGTDNGSASDTGAIAVSATLGSGAASASGIKSIAIGDQSQASGYGGVSVGAGTSTSGLYSNAYGFAASASSNGSAIGAYANASAAYGEAIGYSASASGAAAVATGGYATATGSFAIASGWHASATAQNAIAIGGQDSGAGGTEAQAAANYAIAVGTTAVVNSGATRGMALGTGATVGSSGADAIAIGTGATATTADAVALGHNAQASGTQAVAIGNGAIASHANAVAIGNGSVTSASNSVSVGSVGNERRIMNVAGPILDTDAATKGYVDSAETMMLASARAYTDSQISSLSKEAFRGIAQAAAIIPMAPAGAGQTTVNAGVAGYGGESAGGIAVAHQFNDAINLNAGVGFSGGSKSLVRAGVGWRF